jgi:hypothetical protein
MMAEWKKFIVDHWRIYDSGDQEETDESPYPIFIDAHETSLIF